MEHIVIVIMERKTLKNCAVLLVLVLVLTSAVVDAKRTKRSKKRRSSGSGGGGGVTRTYQLEHALNPDAPNEWKSRGTMTTKVQKLSRKASVAFMDSPSLSGADLSNFNKLLATNTPYRVRVRADPADEASPFVIASTRPCLLQAALFMEYFQLHLDVSGRLVSFEYLLSEGIKCNNATSHASAQEAEFVSKATVTAAIRVPTVPAGAVGGAPYPGQRRNGAPGAAAGASGELSDGGKDAEQKPAPSSSWTRYMYYALPIMLFMMLRGGPEPPAGQGGAGPRGGSRK